MEPNQLLSLIEDGLATARKVPPAGASFAASVSEKLRGIHETVTKRGKITDKQVNAVTNMVSGLYKWIDPPQQ